MLQRALVLYRRLTPSARNRRLSLNRVTDLRIRCKSSGRGGVLLCQLELRYLYRYLPSLTFNLRFPITYYWDRRRPLHGVTVESMQVGINRCLLCSPLFLPLRCLSLLRLLLPGLFAKSPGLGKGLLLASLLWLVDHILAFIGGSG